MQLDRYDLWFGFVALLLEWKSYSLTCDRHFRYWSALASLFWALQYVFLGALTAAVNIASTGFRSLVSVANVSSRSRFGLLCAFIFLFAYLTLLSWQGPVSLLPALAVMNTTVALFYYSRSKMRGLLMLSSVAWIANDIFWSAWMALIAESLSVVINYKTIRKLNREK